MSLMVTGTAVTVKSHYTVYWEHVNINRHVKKFSFS